MADKNSGKVKDREITGLKEEVSNLKRLLKLRQDDDTVCDDKNGNTEDASSSFRGDVINCVSSSFGGSEKIVQMKMNGKL